MPKNLADIFEALLGSLFLFRLEFEDPINLLKNRLLALRFGL